MKDSRPLVSVVMSVYNGESFLRESIESILNQEFKDFELIIINDGSTDSTQKIIKSYTDKRIKLVNQKNSGLVASLNRAIHKAKGEYIARQDDDDISYTTRLSKELFFLSHNPEYVMVGSAFDLIDEKNQKIGIEAFPTRDTDLKRALTIQNPFAHGSVMYRKSAVLEAGLYSNDFGPAEDYALWGEMSKLGKIANLSEPLYKWRINMGGISQTRSKEQYEFSKKIASNIYRQTNLDTLDIKKAKDSINFYKKNNKTGGQILFNYLRTSLNYVYVLFSNRKYKKAFINFIAFIRGGETCIKFLFLYNINQLKNKIKQKIISI